ncbi:MAG: glutamyl-tRNA reductase [Candidatus Methylomirabilota bacterium]
MELFVVGLNHETARIAVRERLHISDKELPSLLDLLGERPEIVERMVLATCNRVEVYGVSEGDARSAMEAVVETLATFRGIPAADFAGALYRHATTEAVRHAFRVPCSLDSLVLGEPQILGQVKAAYAEARARAAVGTVLSSLMEQAFHVAKRVRTETGIGGAPVSIASVGVDLARQIFGDLSGRSVMIVGAGEMAELALTHLREDGVTSVLVANRSHDRAVALAAEFHGRAVTFESFRQEMVAADIVVSCTSAPHVILKKEDLQRIVQERRHRPIFLIDLAADPRDIDPACNELDNVYLYNLDDLEQVVQANRAERQREAGQAEAIVARDVELFLAWLRGLEAVPTIVSLRERVEAIRAQELERALGKLSDLTPEQRAAIAGMTRTMVNKILHQPMTELKRQAAQQNGHLYASVLRRLFGLEER